MQYSNEIFRIIEGALKLDKKKVVNYVNLLETKVREDGDSRTADRLKRIVEKNIETSNMTSSGISFMSTTPVDQESRLSMADIIDYKTIDDDVVLNESEDNAVTKFIESYNLFDKFVESGIEIRSTMLLYGPPGCGKTKLAYHLAKSIKLPLVIARLDSIISSYLGSTAKNIRILFEYAQQNPCILFLDEFDAIAKARDDAHELGELKRVVNSLLQNIDSINKDSVLVAATNHQHILDPAVWRRFQYKIYVDKPTLKSRIQLIENFLEISDLNKDDISKIAMVFKGMSGAEIEEICLKSLRDMLINNSKLTLTSLANNYFDYYNLAQKYMDDDLTDYQQIRKLQKEKAFYLRQLDNKFFSYSMIGEILGLSKSFVGNLLREKSNSEMKGVKIDEEQPPNSNDNEPKT